MALVYSTSVGVKHSLSSTLCNSTAWLITSEPWKRRRDRGNKSFQAQHVARKTHITVTSPCYFIMRTFPPLAWPIILPRNQRPTFSATDAAGSPTTATANFGWVSTSNPRTLHLCFAENSRSTKVPGNLKQKKQLNSASEDRHTASTQLWTQEPLVPVVPVLHREGAKKRRWPVNKAWQPEIVTFVVSCDWHELRFRYYGDSIVKR